MRAASAWHAPQVSGMRCACTVLLRLFGPRMPWTPWQLTHCAAREVHGGDALLQVQQRIALAVRGVGGEERRPLHVSGIAVAEHAVVLGHGIDRGGRELEREQDVQVLRAAEELQVGGVAEELAG